jgi:predicted nucleotide-binding protein
VQEADAVIGLMGGKGTCDCLQKAALARKPIFPIAIAGGGAEEEWERLYRSRYGNQVPLDIEFLNDISLTPKAIALEVAGRCSALLLPRMKLYSKRVFVVHGHDAGLKNEVARLLERLNLEPVILHEQADQGRTIFGKLKDELSDVGFGLVLLTPDDKGSAATSKKAAKRARQNVVFEHGWLMGALGPDRVCAIVKDEVEVPSDLQGIIYKHVPAGKTIDVIAFDLCRELRRAGYDVDANKL